MAYDSRLRKMSSDESTKGASETLSLLPHNEIERTARQRFRCSLSAGVRGFVVVLPRDKSATSVAIPVELVVGADVARQAVQMSVASKRDAASLTGWASEACRPVALAVHLWQTYTNRCAY